MNFSFFCYTCKKFIAINAESEGKAKHEFHKCGHDDTRVKALRPGLVGK